MTTKHKLTIEFPTAEAKQIFATWMSDGGGEQNYFDAMESSATSSLHVGYHGPENKQFDRNDKRRYGKFLCDDTIRVEVIEEESP